MPVRTSYKLLWDTADTLSGINSSEEDRLQDKNEHFRSYEIQFPKTNQQASHVENEKTPQGKISFLSKTSLFTTPTTVSAKREEFQRVIRLSPPQRNAAGLPNKRIGAIASSLAGNENEMVIFSATTNRPDNVKDVIERVALSKGQEVEDIDILDEGEGLFQVAYCLAGEVFVQPILYDFDKKKNLGKPDSRRMAYSVPFPDSFEKKNRPKIRSIRWLSPSHILLLTNKHNRTGVMLWVLRLYDDGPGSIIMRKTLPRHAKAAVGMDVALLDADSDGAYQAVIAVAAIDVSLTVLTIDYHGQSKDSLSQFHSYATYQNVRSQSDLMQGDIGANIDRSTSFR
jgi:prolactin regulatory element-binding protein